MSLLTRRTLAAALLPALAASLVTASAPTIARAQAAGGNVAAADAKIQSATAHYQKNELGAALADLAEAYNLDPRPDLLYAMAQIEIHLNDCTGAHAHLKQYLTTNPPAKARTAAEKAKATCDEKLGLKDDDDAAKVEPTTTAPVQAPAEPQKKLVTVERPFYADPVGDGLMVGGVVLGLAAGGLYLKALSDNNAAGANLEDHNTLQQRARDLRNYAVIAGAVGGALAIGAVVRWTIHGGGTETHEEGDVTVGLGPSPDGTGWGFAAIGRF